MIKLLIGGSPCTHWSIAQTKNRETEPKGDGWSLPGLIMEETVVTQTAEVIEEPLNFRLF